MAIKLQSANEKSDLSSRMKSLLLNAVKKRYTPPSNFYNDVYSNTY